MVRARLEYKDAGERRRPVARCPLHRQKDDSGALRALGPTGARPAMANAALVWFFRRRVPRHARCSCPAHCPFPTTAATTTTPTPSASLAPHVLRVENCKGAEYKVEPKSGACSIVMPLPPTAGASARSNGNGAQAVPRLGF